MKITVNGKEIEATEGETLLTALKREGFDIPTLCYLEGMNPSGACRVCVVEIEGQSNLVTSCSYPVAAGLKVKTHSPKVINARKTLIELLMGSHPDDCLYCDKQDKCELLALARKYGVTKRRFPRISRNANIDVSGPSIVRDPEKCVLCGKCVRVCEEVQKVGCIDFSMRGFKSKISCAFDSALNVSSCVNCGQCVTVCPTGALMENNNIEEVKKALESGKHVVVQHAPAVSVSLGEEFGLPLGKDVDGLMVSALREMGFKAVFDTSFAADLTIMEEASELAERIKKNGKLPMFTSCCPGWVKYVETFYPEFMENLSTCKSPHQMLGAIIKSYYAKKEGIDPKDIIVVSIMPCTAKKFEVKRAEMKNGELEDVDFSLTTRELARMINIFGIDFKNLKPSRADLPFGERSGAGKIFGASGGVMEAAVRTANYLLTGKELAELKFEPVRGLKGFKKAEVKIGDKKIRLAVISALGNAKDFMDALEKGEAQADFVEVMACPGGCVNGGGQPFAQNKKAISERAKALYEIDSSEKLRVSHENKALKTLYKDFLVKPLGEKSHRLLHTSYKARSTKDR
ncbi:MAG: 2Fe-2S iron-sulfur cluster binding domain-containing protein [Elusimicrobia bacterium]|nr:2Fe-2S iron-sulfur cluster binding domain-containing protein [Elusimicrobiota bacterium]